MDLSLLITLVAFEGTSVFFQPTPKDPNVLGFFSISNDITTGMDTENPFVLDTEYGTVVGRYSATYNTQNSADVFEIISLPPLLEVEQPRVEIPELGTKVVRLLLKHTS